ncbi:hypothetical protein D3C74_345300 [compost metagenome]
MQLSIMAPLRCCSSCARSPPRSGAGPGTVGRTMQPSSPSNCRSRAAITSRIRSARRWSCPARPAAHAKRAAMSGPKSGCARSIHAPWVAHISAPCSSLKTSIHVFSPSGAISVAPDQPAPACSTCRPPCKLAALSAPASAQASGMMCSLPIVPAPLPGAAAPRSTSPARSSSSGRAVIQPTVSKPGASGITPSISTAPCVGRKPYTPQYADGTRTEPPVSVPSAKSTSPEATATAEPLEEPPGIRPLARGLTGVP